MIKIGLYDIWIGNKDRRSDNPNLLLESSSTAFKIIPIDNTQTFANQSCYKALNLAVMDMNNEKSILTTPLSKSICNFANSKDYINLAKEVLLGIENSLDSANAIFENIPSQLGLSKMGKERIKLILSDKDRNNKISQLHLNYQK